MTRLLVLPQVIECFAGVFGFRPVMEPYIPEEMRIIYLHRVTEDKDRVVKELNNAYQSGKIIKFQLQEYLKKVEREYKMLANVPSDLDLHLAQIFRENLICLGVSQYKLEKFIQWRIGWINPLEAEHLTALVKHIMNAGEWNKSKEEWNKINVQLASNYSWVMKYPILKNLPGNKSEDKRKDWMKLSYEEQQQYYPYYQKVTHRIIWQATELQLFVCNCFHFCDRILEQEPVKVPSGKYEEKLKIERTQIDLINEMAQELANLPRFIAYVKVIQEEEGKQVVVRCKMETIPLSDTDKDFVIPPLADSYYKKREEVEEEIQQRWKKWKGGLSVPPPTVLSK